MSNVVQIGEDEGFFDIETHSDDVFGVHSGHFSGKEEGMRKRRRKEEEKERKMVG